MTEAERLLLCVLADTLLVMARNPMAAIDTARLAKARFALDEEAHRMAHRVAHCADSGDRRMGVCGKHGRWSDAEMCPECVAELKRAVMAPSPLPSPFNMKETIEMMEANANALKWSNITLPTGWAETLRRPMKGETWR